ncbi:MAG TPA: PrsW family glutamic-type intramembrane protease [Chloroflexota bacterium]|nr:PrsW family glutamic-type intramembrane protease [Chloroflexota bacterium]
MAYQAAGDPPGILKSRPDQSLPSWRSVFFTGLVLWIASVVVTALTQNLNMIPTVILLGSFLVPATAVIWYLDHYHSPELTMAVVFRAFIVGGVLGVLAASLLESWLLSEGILIYLGVGLIEEAAKLLGLWFVARHLARYTIRDGIVLGATVGFGFAALESSGYALSALLVTHGSQLSLSLGNLVYTEFLRGILSPVGHGLWTAILGAALFRVARNGRLRLTWSVLGAYIFVSVLHALWDSMRGIATVVTAVLAARHTSGIGVGGGAMTPPDADLIGTFLAIEVGGLVVISLIGLAVLISRWRGAAEPAVAEPV